MNTTDPKSSRLWLWFVAAFAVQALVWTALFIVAHQNPVAEVPLVGAGAPAPDAKGQKSDVSRSSSLKP